MNIFGYEIVNKKVKDIICTRVLGKGAFGIAYLAFWEGVIYLSMNRNQ